MEKQVATVSVMSDTTFPTSRTDNVLTRNCNKVQDAIAVENCRDGVKYVPPGFANGLDGREEEEDTLKEQSWKPDGPEDGRDLPR